jgi:hypothetical protein
MIMVKRALLVASCLVFLVAANALARPQDPPPPPSANSQEKPPVPPSPAPQPTPAPAPAPAPTPAPPPRAFGQPVAVRIDLTITDQVGSAAPLKKTMTMMAADGERASVRSMNGAPGQNAQFNVDAKPMLTQDKIRLDLSINYDAPDLPQQATSDKAEKAVSWSTRLQESMGVIVENGKPIIISQSADPRTDRKVSVEVKATILK